MRRAGYTIIEIVCITALVAILTAIFGQFFVQGMRATQLARARADISSQLLWISEFWPKSFGDTKVADWRCTGDHFSAGDRQIAYADYALELSDGPVSGKVVLPGNMEANFRIELPEVGPPCAVLEVGWDFEHLGARGTNHARFVTCGGARP